MVHWSVSFQLWIPLHLPAVQFHLGSDIPTAPRKKKTGHRATSHFRAGPKSKIPSCLGRAHRTKGVVTWDDTHGSGVRTLWLFRLVICLICIVLYNRQYNYYIKVIFMYFLVENPLLGLHSSESYQVFLVVVQLYENASAFAGTITDICFPTVTPMTNMQVTSLNRMSSFFLSKKLLLVGLLYVQALESSQQLWCELCHL